MSEPDEVEFVAVGRITRAHGVHGEVAVLPLSQVGSRFEPGSRLVVDGTDRTLVVSSGRPHRRRMLVSFEGISDRTAAEQLAGRYLMVPAADSPKLPEGEFWPHQLVGCDVVTEEGRGLGRIREIIHTQANDVWVTDGESGELLLPALKDVVASVEMGSRRVVVRDVPGLTSP